MRTIWMSLCLLALATLSCTAWAQDEGGGTKPRVEIYDLDALLNETLDYPAPPVGDAAVVDPFQNAAHADKTGEALIEELKANIEPDSWGMEKGTRIEMRGHNLMVVQFPAVQERVRKFLSERYNAQNTQLRTQVMVIEATPADVVGLLDSTGKPLPEARVKEVLEKGRLYTAPQVLCRNNQLSHNMSGTMRTYIRDVDVNGDTYDPVIGNALEGTLLEIRPTLDLEHHFAVVDTNLTLNRKVTIEDRDGTSTTVVPGAFHAKEKPANAGAAPATPEKTGPVPVAPHELQARITLQSAKVEGSSMRGSVTVPLGKWVLADILNSNDEDKPLLVFMLVEEVK